MRPWSLQPLLEVAGAVVDSVEEVGYLGVAELGPVTAAVCPLGWGTVGRCKATLVSLPQEELEQMRLVIPPGLGKGSRSAKQPEYLSPPLHMRVWWWGGVTRMQPWRRRPQHRLHTPRWSQSAGLRGDVMEHRIV